MFENITINYLTFIVSLIVLLIITIEAILKIRKWLNRRTEYKEYDEFLDDPFKSIKFLIPRLENYKINYYKQYEKKHQTLSELKLSHQSKQVIFLMWQPKENFETSDMYFGFEGEKGKKPKIIRYKNPFVIRPTPHEPEWYQDWHEDFHLVKQKYYFKYENYVTGFEIITNEKGSYDMYVKFPIICDRYKSIRERRQKKVIIKKLKVIVK